MRRPDGSGTLDMDLAAPGGIGSEHTARQLTHTLRIVLTDQAAHVILRTREETALLTVDPVSREPVILGQAYPNQFKVHVPSNPELLRILEANPQVNLHVLVKSGQQLVMTGRTTDFASSEGNLACSGGSLEEAAEKRCRSTSKWFDVNACDT